MATVHTHSTRHSGKVRRILRWEAGTCSEAADEVAEEQPLEIRVGGRPVNVTMRTPGHDVELAAGFLLSEGVIRCASDVLRIQHCGSTRDCNVLNVLLASGVDLDIQRLTRHVFASSSCGLCGKASIEAIRTLFPPIDSAARIDPATLARLPDAMRNAQAVFARTGGLHAAGLFDVSGRLLVVREDVGRHNAVDKALGHALLQGEAPLEEHVLLVSGRCSFEIMQKALAARVPIVAAVSAPSSLAVEFAQENRQTLIGFLRGPRMNVYAHPDRLGDISSLLAVSVPSRVA
jgi:FdhD protein